jgi:hypothetical protein
MKYSPDRHVTTLNYTKQYLKESLILPQNLLVEKYVISNDIHLILIFTKIGQVVQEVRRTDSKKQHADDVMISKVCSSTSEEE